MNLNLVRIAVLLTFCYSVLGQDCLPEKDRIDCYPFEGVTETICEAKGCSYCSSSTSAPSCYLPANYGYVIDGSVVEIPGGYRVNLRRATNISYVGGDADAISIFFYTDLNERIRIKITDNTERFEVPLGINPPSNPVPGNPLYRLEYSYEPVFSFKVVRVSSGVAVFDTSLGGLTFADQFIQIVNKVPSINGYGIGENEQLTYRHDFTKWQVFGLYTRDNTPEGNVNIYGAHPTYTMVEDDGNTHTVLFLNSNAQEFILTPAPSYTYRTIGGLLDIYIFMGPTPEEAVAQYHQAIGPQPIPAYWSLGFNLCRWSYNSVANMRATIDRLAAAGIPQDVQFGDLDVMYDWLTFTYDSNDTYNAYSQLPEFIRELKSRGIHFIQSVNAQISSEDRRLPSYEPLQLGNDMDVWVRRPDGSTSTGTLWPGGEGSGWTKTAGPGYGGPVYFADFSRPATIDWWYTLCNNYRQQLEWDGLWLDMNEPASWVDGDVNGCADNLINRPPYTPGIMNNISDLTICPDHIQDYGKLYDTHSLYGWSEARGSFEAIQRIFGTNRTFQLSRSTFPGSGKWAAHWLGDNFSTWGNYAASFIGIMGFNLFGIPQSGVDICGFYGRPSEELCTRWLQAGAFFPYSRNHNVRSESSQDQDPGIWSEVSRNSTRDALMIRYTILPYIYHLFYIHRVKGGTVMRAIWHEFSTDYNALRVDTQFLVGPGFLVSPVVTEGATSVNAYFPKGRWYSYYTGAEQATGYAYLSAPISFINLHVRGGYILPTQDPALNTMLSRKNPFGLIIALDETFSAKGDMYYDDGITHEVQQTSVYFLSTITYSKGSLTQTVINNGYPDISTLNLETIRLMGAPGTVDTILVNGVAHTDFEILESNEIQVYNLKIPVNSRYTITFTESNDLGQDCLPEKDRIDCYPFQGVTETICTAKGCSYCSSSTSAPSCYLPANYGYVIDGSVVEIPGGYRVNLRRATNISYVGGDADAISIFFYTDLNERIRIKIETVAEDLCLKIVLNRLLRVNKQMSLIQITDNTERFEVPLGINPPSNPVPGNPLYRLEYSYEPVFSFKVVRVSSGVAVFDTSLGGLTFADQFIQIVNKVPSINGYGIGENEQLTYRHDFTKWQVFGLYTRDNTPEGNVNIYGAHPTYTMVEDDGNTHTVLFLNSNAQEFILTPAPSYTYRTIGGLLDIYIFMGPTPEEAVAQYHQAIGPQPIPAYWSLGFNLCRWSYNSVANMRATIDRLAAAGIPQDVQFGDLDVMYDWLTFTYDSNDTYNAYSQLPEFIRELKSRGIHFIQSVNAQISSEDRRLPSYDPLRLGNEMDVWVRRPDGSTSTGTLWPGGEGSGWTKTAGPGYGGPVYFADFSRPATIDWWYTLCNNYRQQLEWDGLWLDMNEPASWVDGDVNGCANNLINRPPYTPGIMNNISDLTICPDHIQDYGKLYDTHSLYGWSEARGSFEAIQRIFGTNRTFQLSRSTFPGSGKWAAHWLGDNFSTWGNYAASFIGIMGFNLFGIPQSGVDICGFYGRPSEELCTRWLQAGAFFPYSRNHNVRSESSQDQDPGIWSEVSRNSTRDALMIRYTILPYIYHLFYIHRVKGGTVMRAIWHEFSTDYNALRVDTQFLVGPGFLVSPVVTEGATSVNAYFPKGRWYSYYTGAEQASGYAYLSAPISFINLHVRGGYILPTQDPALNTMLSRKNPFGLIIALDETFSAKGDMYYDDGITHEVQQTSVYFLSTITYSNGTLTQTVINNGYSDISTLNLETIRLMGAPGTVDIILVNGVAHTDFEILESNEIQVYNLKIPVNSRYTITFTDSNGSSGQNAIFGYNFILFYIHMLYSLTKFVLNM